MSHGQTGGRQAKEIIINFLNNVSAFFLCPSASSLAPLHGGFVPLTSRLYKGVLHGSPATPRHLLLDLKFEF